MQSFKTMHGEQLCSPCVYFSGNLDQGTYPELADGPHPCGLGYRPGDVGCSDMRTNNCSARNSKS